jgi:hypothetical protein
MMPGTKLAALFTEVITGAEDNGATIRITRASVKP